MEGALLVAGVVDPGGELDCEPVSVEPLPPPPHAASTTLMTSAPTGTRARTQDSRITLLSQFESAKRPHTPRESRTQRKRKPKRAAAKDARTAPHPETPCNSVT